MTASDIERVFPCGPVEQSYGTIRFLLWVQRIAGILLVGGLLYLSRWQPYIVWRFVHYGLALFLLWRLHHSGAPVAFVCQKGIVVKRLPLGMSEYVSSWFHEEELLVYVPYEAIIGFTEKWEHLLAQAPSGGLYMIRVDLQLVSHNNKVAIYERIEREHKKS